MCTNIRALPEGGGEIISVAEGSPFDDAGFTPGCRILSVDGNPA